MDSFDVPLKMPLLEIAELAVRPDNKVWVVHDGKLSVRRIRVAQVMDGRALVVGDDSQLAAGEQVIVSPLPVIEDGMAVRHANAPASASEPSEKPAEASSP